jgi:tetratricopeptide (TPR) repeat protein
VNVERHLTAAQGYLELDMPAEALDELKVLPQELLQRWEIQQLLLVVLMRLRNWSEALSVCQFMRQHFPEQTVGFIHGAFCLHELGQTSEARDLLLSGPPSLLREPTYHYNLGCYAAVMGQPEEALQHLRTSFAMDKSFIEIARRDPDLKNLPGLL